MIPKAAELRKEAREALKGQFGKVALINLLFASIFFLLNQLFDIPILGVILSICYTIIIVPISYGLIQSMMKLKRKEDVDYFDFFKDGFANFNRSWAIVGRVFLKLLCPISLVILGIALTLIGFLSLAITFSNNIFYYILIVVGILITICSYIFFLVQSLNYTFTRNIAIDNKNMSPSECVQKSYELMNGNKKHFFFLILTFIGWYLLAVLICVLADFLGSIASNIAFIAVKTLLESYYLFAVIAFYEHLYASGNNVNTKKTTPTEKNSNAHIQVKSTAQEKSGSQIVKAEIVDIPVKDPNVENK